eukprot:6731927-Prymnesium_polylepis.1
MERCWCAVEAAAVNSMGENLSQFLPLMRQAIVQVEWAVAPDDMLLEPLEPLVVVPLEHSEAHASGSGTE